MAMVGLYRPDRGGKEKEREGITAQDSRSESNGKETPPTLLESEAATVPPPTPLLRRPLFYDGWGVLA